MSTPIIDRPKNRFIDPKVLMKIQNLELIARTVVEGFVTGLHKSPYLGFSVDFVWKPTSFERMHMALKRCVVDEYSLSGCLSWFLRGSIWPVSNWFSV